MGDNPDDNRAITANFTSSDLHCTVKPSPDPAGGGSVQLKPSQPAGGYPVNQSVSVWAVAQTGYVFSHWTGDVAGLKNPSSIVLNEDKSFTAYFNPTVSVRPSPTEGGSVPIQTESSTEYPAGTQVTITAKGEKGYRFVSWEGDASGFNRSTTITVDEPKTITARFAE
jgi:hypothetical protein